MSIVRWEVSAWADEPRRYEFERETEKCWFIGKARYLKAGTVFSSWYETETEALEAIAQRNVREDENRRLNNLRAHAPQLLDLLERVLAAAEHGEFMMESERGRGREIEELYEAGEMPEELCADRVLIAKLK